MSPSSHGSARPRRSSAAGEEAARDIAKEGEVYELPLHKQPVFAPWVDGPLPQSERICATHICLPISAVLTEEQAELVVASLRSVLGSQSLS